MGHAGDGGPHLRELSGPVVPRNVHASSPRVASRTDVLRKLMAGRWIRRIQRLKVPLRERQ
jgi:hypothetical protein